MQSSALDRVAAYIVLPLIVIGVSALSFSCSHGSEWTEPIDWLELGIQKLPGTEEYPDASAIILLDEGAMEIIGSGEISMSVFERHKIVRVLTPIGQRYANVVIPYGSGTKVENIEARTITPDGTIIPVKDEDIFDVSLYPNYIFFSDQRARLFTLPAVEDGSVLEYRYRLRVSGHTLWHSWNFQDKVPTLLSRFTLMSPSQYRVTPKLYCINITPRGAKMPAGFKETTVWEAREVPPLQAEFGMPAEREVEARLALAPLGFGSWNDVAKWYGDLVKPRAAAGTRIRDVVKRLTAGATDDRTRLRRIFEWVQQQVRYMAVEIGIGGYQPHAAEEVCTKLYGDCKDMTTLLCSMAREAGVDVRQALVSTWQNGKPDTSHASPLQFNHVIAYCPSMDGGIWMDATEKWCNFGELPWYDQGLSVLLIGEDGKGEMITTPRGSAAQNSSVDAWDVRLDSTGAAVVRGESRFTGMLAIEQRDELGNYNAADRRRWLEIYLARRCPGAMLDSLEVEGLQPVGKDLRVRYLFHSPMFAVKRGSGLVLHPGWSSASGLPEYFRSPSRIQPVRFRFGLRSEANLTIRFPAGWRPTSPVSADSLRSPFGSAHWVVQASDSILTVRSGHSFVGEEIAPDKYREFQAFLDAMQMGDMGEIEVGRVERTQGTTNTEGTEIHREEIMMDMARAK